MWCVVSCGEKEGEAVSGNQERTSPERYTQEDLVIQARVEGPEVSRTNRMSVVAPEKSAFLSSKGFSNSSASSDPSPNANFSVNVCARRKCQGAEDSELVSTLQ